MNDLSIGNITKLLDGIERNHILCSRQEAFSENDLIFERAKDIAKDSIEWNKYGRFLESIGSPEIAKYKDYNKDEEKNADNQQMDDENGKYS